MKKFGVVTLMGAPNAGKSTLLNAILGEKLSIVCHKRQTTLYTSCRYFNRRGYTNFNCGYPRHFFLIRKKSWIRQWYRQHGRPPFEAHLIFLIVDVKASYLKEDIIKIISKLESVSDKVVLILNKIDLFKDKSSLLSLTKELSEVFSFKDVFMVSSKKKEGVDRLVSFMKKNMPDGAWVYPEDQLTNLSERFLTAELTREVLLHQLHEEIPYGLTVQTEKWETFDNEDVKVFQMICLERMSHKAIVLGKKGQKIKHIGVLAREEMSKALGCRVHLKLHVKVDENWQDKPDFFHDLGLDPN
ncbi:MAG: GTPase Era [Holosporaceae bacterium]|nr:MAG: GTPase Era [Holosporaceae bacterium]